MEATVARVRDFVRKRISGERIWRVSASVTPSTVGVTLYTPDKPERLTEGRDKGRSALVEVLSREIEKSFERPAVVNVVQAPSAVVKFQRITPRKVRLVADTIRYKNVQDALAILQFVPNSAAKTLAKLIKSAVANAENNHRMDAEALEIIHVHVDEGPSLKRISPRAMGRAYRILKRTSHITVGLAESEQVSRLSQRGKTVARTVGKTTRRSVKADASKGKPAAKGAEKTAPAEGSETKPARQRKRGGGS